MPPAVYPSSFSSFSSSSSRGPAPNLQRNKRPRVMSDVTTSAGYGQLQLQPAAACSAEEWTPDPLGFSITYLSTELLTLILQEVWMLEPHSLWTARLACRRLDVVATPILYRTVAFSQRMLSPESEREVPYALENVYTHARSVIARSDLDPVRMKVILKRIQKLQNVKFCYVDEKIQSGEFYMPADILDREQMRRQETRLYVENLPLRNFEAGEENLYLRAIPAGLMVSLKMGRPTPPLVTRLRSLKQLVLASPRLETLWFEDRGQGTHFEFVDCEILPKLRDLSLRSYDWRHSRWDMIKHWPLYELVRLRLTSVPMVDFFRSVKMGSLRKLKVLHCDDFSAHRPDDGHREATASLLTAVRDFVAALRVLSLTLHTEDFPPAEALRRHGPTLEMLRLRDHVGFSEERRRCPTYSPAVVWQLSALLPRLEMIELDMDLDFHKEVPAFLRALVQFPRLHSITLHVQTTIRPFEEVAYRNLWPERRLDRDRAHALHMVQFLAANRRRLRNGPLFRAITINVGGWKRVMVRRLGEVWRELNENGMYAERCFLMEGRGDDGDYFREVAATEVN